jgi:RNA polymerase sigma-70 factor (ECF subfamily)
VNPEKQRLSAGFVADRHRLMAFIRGLVRDSHVAEDIFQEVWVRLADAMQGDVDIENTPAWCRGVARNLILHHWRDTKRAKVIADSELLDIVERSFVEQDARCEYWHEREKALRDCLDELPEKSRRVLSLKYDSGLSAAAVAERLHKTAAAVMMLLSRLRRSLTECARKKLELWGFTG